MLTALLLAASVSCALGQWPNSNPTLPGWGEPVGIDCQCSDVSPRIANTETVNTTCAAQKDNCDQPFMLNSVKELAEGERTLSQADATTARRQVELAERVRVQVTARSPVADAPAAAATLRSSTMLA